MKTVGEKLCLLVLLWPSEQRRWGDSPVRIYKHTHTHIMYTHVHVYSITESQVSQLGSCIFFSCFLFSWAASTHTFTFTLLTPSLPPSTQWQTTDTWSETKLKTETPPSRDDAGFHAVGQLTGIHLCRDLPFDPMRRRHIGMQILQI